MLVAAQSSSGVAGFQLPRVSHTGTGLAAPLPVPVGAVGWWVSTSMSSSSIAVVLPAPGPPRITIRAGVGSRSYRSLSRVTSPVVSRTGRLGPPSVAAGVAMSGPAHRQDTNAGAGVLILRALACRCQADKV